MQYKIKVGNNLIQPFYKIMIKIKIFAYKFNL